MFTLDGFLHVALVLPTILFVPGYAFLSVLFPEGSRLASSRDNRRTWGRQDHFGQAGQSENLSLLGDVERLALSVALSLACDSLIVFENLKGIKGLGWSHLWAYFRFKQVITYKAHQHGIPTVTLGKAQTRHTSQDCSACGRRTSDEDDDGRIARAQFRCDAWEYGPADADSNAAINIATRQLSTLFS